MPRRRGRRHPGTAAIGAAGRGFESRGTGPAIAFLKNVLMRLPEYRRWLAALSTPREEVGEPIHRFLVLPNPKPQPAAADESLAFTVQGTRAHPRRLGGCCVDGRGRAAGACNTGRCHRAVGWPFRVDASASERTGPRESPGDMRDGVLAADLNYDFKTDLVITGGRGLTLLRQQERGTFADVTAAARLPDAVRSSAAVPEPGRPTSIPTAISTWSPRRWKDRARVAEQRRRHVCRAGAVRAGDAVRGFVWADADGDGVPDAALLDAAGVTRTYINARGGIFRERPVPASFPKAVALAAAEVTDDSVMDVLALGRPVRSWLLKSLTVRGGRPVRWRA